MTGSTGADGTSGRYRYRFGTAEYDDVQCTLRVAGLEVDIQRKPLAILAMLLHNAGEVVTREELFARLWPGMVTVENVLANAVTKLRSALGPDNAAHIVTMPRIGYRFDGLQERIALRYEMRQPLAMEAGQRVPQRDNFILDARLGQFGGSEVWRARHRATGETRVYKFATTDARVQGLRREATIARLLRENLGERDDLVRIIDWNLATPPFFLEFAYGGRNLAEWADSTGALAAMTPGQRLQLFLQVADVVAAAHGVGVLHKDLKPTNVLVQPRGDGWQVQITDFGNAGLLEPDRLADLGITDASALMPGATGSPTLGTPLYLAPELLAGQVPTVQSDVYALGLVLYQCLVANLHLPLAPGWERGIADELLCEVVAQATDGDPRQRLASASVLVERLRGLEARRADRLRERAAAGRARDNEEALRRARARRPWVAATLAVLLAGLVTTATLYTRLRHSSDALASQYQLVRSLNGFLARDLIGAANPEQAAQAAMTVAQAARAAAARIDDEFNGDRSLTRVTLHAAMQDALAGLADYEGAAEEGRKALAAYTVAVPQDPALAIDIRLRLASSLSSLSRYGEANAELDKARAEIARAGLQDSVQQARLWYVAAQVAGERLSLQEHLSQLQQAWALAGRHPEAPDDLRDDIELHLGDAYTMLDRNREGEPLLRDLMERQARQRGAGHPRTLFTVMGLGDNLAGQGRLDDASRLLASAASGLVGRLGAEHHKTLEAQFRLASVHFLQKRFDLAAPEFAQVYAVLAHQGKVRQDFTVATEANWAVSLHYGGDPARAVPVLEDALANARAFLPENSPRVQDLRYGLADCLLDLRRPSRVPALLAGLDPAALEAADDAPDWDGLLAYQSGRAALQLGRAAEAEALLRKALLVVEAKDPHGRISTGVVRSALDEASRPDTRTASR